MSDDPERSEALALGVDWAPAYELLASYIVLLQRGKHPLLELGNGWLKDVRLRLPTEFEHGAPAITGKHEDDLLLLLIKGCPASRDVDSWLDWLGQLSAGGAYEVLANLLPAHGVRLPRDFVPWRDRIVGLLRVWQRDYFDAVDPAILDGLQQEADRLRAHLTTMPARELVEQITNGMWVEPVPGMVHVELVPQFHIRPYNHDCNLADGVMLLYPADVLPQPPDGPPAALLRLTRGLSDESRLRILRFLSLGTRSLTEGARFAGLSQPTVHHHLAQLRSAGLVRVHRSLAGPVRYSLRSHALEQLVSQLGTYLEPIHTEGEA
jgi:DNA-binding transcriptional ArsR family regulator